MLNDTLYLQSFYGAKLTKKNQQNQINQDKHGDAPIGLCLQVELELELGVLFILERRRLENKEENLRSKDDWGWTSGSHWKQALNTLVEFQLLYSKITLVPFQLQFCPSYK